MPVSWKRQPAAITTSASRRPMPWSATVAGSTPARDSRRNSRSAMLTTIWMCTQEWSDIPSRSAFTCCMYHQARRRSSPLAAASSASSFRLPRVGARISISGSSTDRKLLPGYAVPVKRQPSRAPLVDGHGRRIEDVRVSVTDRCNFRCQYCMPAEGLAWLERREILSFEEIERVVGLLAEMGVHDVRLTGGEPLVRREFPALVGKLALIDGIDDLSLTTNGYLLERDADALEAAGIDRVNVSIDSLQRDRFFHMTRRDALPQVLRGLDALAKHPQV